MLEIHQAGPVAKDPLGGDDVQLPTERAGLLMVFKPYKRVSYALIMEALVPLHVKDYVATP